MDYHKQSSIPCLSWLETHTKMLPVWHYVHILVKHILSRIREARSLLSGHHTAVVGILVISTSCQVLAPNTNHLCGQIYKNSYAIFNMTWELKLLSGYSTKLIFHKLNSIYSKECEINSVLLQKVKSCNHHDRYCGYLPPWNETFPGSNVLILMIINLPRPPTQFLLSYHLLRTPLLTSQTAMYIVGNSRMVFGQTRTYQSNTSKITDTNVPYQI